MEREKGAGTSDTYLAGFAISRGIPIATHRRREPEDRPLRQPAIGLAEISAFHLQVATPNLRELGEKLFPLPPGLLSPGRFLIQIVLARDSGILQRVRPAAQLPGNAFRPRS